MRPPLPDDTLLMENGGETEPTTPGLGLFSVGDVLNETYEVCGVLGAGAMGQVFEAYDRVLDRRVAIKAVHPGAGLRTLRHEAQVLAAIRHPGTVGVYSMGIHR